MIQAKKEELTIAYMHGYQARMTEEKEALSRFVETLMELSNPRNKTSIIGAIEKNLAERKSAQEEIRALKKEVKDLKERGD